MSDTQRRVCIAVPTFRRPASLEALLDGIAAIVAPEQCAVSVLVMDNDHEQSARATVSSRAERFPYALTYAHVAQPGLCAVRNFALDYAAENAYDLLAMIDDDEVPEPQWLTELLRVSAATGADAVVGPVPQAIPPQAPGWVRSAPFFDLPVYTDGAPMGDGYSGNCLLRVRTVERLGIRFDPAFNFAGGEDLIFFRTLLRRGGTLRYAAKAIAEESLGAERLRVSYVLALNFRRGNTLALYDRRLDGRMHAPALRALKAGTRLLRGCGTLLPQALLRGKAGAVNALCDIAHGAGGFAGLCGHMHQAYRRSANA